LCPCISDPRAKSGVEEEPGRKIASGWRQGIDLVNKFLEVRPASSVMDLTEMITTLDLDFANSIEEPGLFVDNSCVDLIREFNNYRAPDNGRGDTNIREAAQAYDDHALDALRYGLMHLFKLHTNSHLSDIYTPQDLVPVDIFGNTSIPSGGYFQLPDMRF
jgi:hypothetical protein